MSGHTANLPPLGRSTTAKIASAPPAMGNLTSPVNADILIAGAELPARKVPPPLDTMRAYRACLNCRSRKSKCDLEGNGGRPPCRRCQREDRECVLGESHRGGRRVRKKPKVDGNLAQNSPDAPQHSTFQSPTITSPTYSSLPSQQNLQSPHVYQPPYSNRSDPTYSWQRTSNVEASESGERHSFHENIASANLQNPSDALEILAHVADQAEEGDSGSERQGQHLQDHPALRLHAKPPSIEPDDHIHYKPLQSGMISTEIIYNIFSTYEEFFHPYFPIIPRETFNRARLPWLSQREPHLFSAILTIASKDDEGVHKICYDHMKDLVCMLTVGAEAGVEGVEAMLLLSQWVSHRSHASLAIGRGEEDRVAWMHIGTAVRLAYYLGIDRTSFRRDNQEDPTKYNRARIVWLACYLCDRQVSVRLGKAFWSRGPGPLSGIKAMDFPTLQPLNPGDEDRASIFQANLELTQIFSNCHDILYSSKEHGWKSMLEGRYAKYLDDFRAAIRNWDRDWGHLIGSPPSKPSLQLTYDYLRLYVNAFGYQATIARAVVDPRDPNYNPGGVMPLINASATDARFIYEALDAAKDLLQHFNEFVDVETLRYMPSLYYLYIVYSAVFLYKARATTTMANDERVGVRRIVLQTIDRLHKANHMGSRYARLLQMLWRKSPRGREPPQQHNDIDPRLQQPQQSYAAPTFTNGYPQNLQTQPTIPTSFSQTSPIPTNQLQISNLNLNPTNMSGQQQPQAFSWLDLDATWNFATQNGGDDIMGLDGLGMDGMDGIDGFSETSPFERGGYMPDMSFLEKGSEGLPF